MKRNNASILQKILSIDIGGTHIKATVLDENGKLLRAYNRVATPEPATPANVMAAIKTMIKGFPDFDKISAGFPGYVRDGIIQTAPNLDKKGWQQFNLAKSLTDTLSKPARVINDADMQGLGVVSGKGLEMMITLGTGFGTALLKDGTLMPHVEIAHHPITKSKDYDEYIGDAAMKKIGALKWNIRMQRVLAIIKTVFNYDVLYIGGGNAEHLSFKLNKNIKIVTNMDGIHGGARLWKQDGNSFKTSIK